MTLPTAIIKTATDHWFTGLTTFGETVRAVRLAGIAKDFAVGEKVTVIQSGYEFGFADLGSVRGQIKVPGAQVAAVASQAKANVSLARIAQLANNSKIVYQPATIDAPITSSSVRANGNILPSDISNFYDGARGLIMVGKVSRVIGWWNSLEQGGLETDGGYEVISAGDFPPAPEVDYSITSDGKYWKGNPGGYYAQQSETPDGIYEDVFFTQGDNYGDFFPDRFSTYPDPDARIVWISRQYFTANIFMSLAQWIAGEFVVLKTVSIPPIDPRSTIAYAVTQPTTKDDIYMYSTIYEGTPTATYATRYIRWLKY